MSDYSDLLKSARMLATRDFLAGGSLEVLTDDDTVLIIFPITGGSVVDDVLSLDLQPNSLGLASGVAAKAQLKNSAGIVSISGLTVGLNGSGSSITMQNTSIEVGQSFSSAISTITHADISTECC
jgi:hypothetical protein